MRKQILIDESLSMIRIGVIQEGTLLQVYIEDGKENIGQSTVIQGQVQKVVKNLKAAFIDFGKEKNGLLHFSGVPELYVNHLQQGMRIPVQVQKENKGEKGDRLTGQISIQGYYLVALPFDTTIQVSKKIKDKRIRESLKAHLESLERFDIGFIIRTNAQEATQEELVKEATYLINKILHFRKMKDTMQKGTVLIELDPLYWQVVKEHVSPSDEVEIICNNEATQADIEEKQQIFMPHLQVTYRTYPYYENIFRLMSIEKDFMDILKKKIWLKNGGNIVIDHTEAMTVIDVNSAKAIDGKNASVAIRKLNELAIEESLHQIIRRNLSGIIIIDLVDFKSNEDRQAVYEFARERFSALDGKRSKIYPPTELDLLQIARTKKYLPIHQKLLDPVGERYIEKAEYSLAYAFFELESKIKTIAAQTAMQAIYLYCSHDLFVWIKDTQKDLSLQETYHLSIKLIKNEALPKRSFEIKYHL